LREAHLPEAAREPANAISRSAGAAIFAARAEHPRSYGTAGSAARKIGYRLFVPAAYCGACENPIKRIFVSIE